MMEDSPLSSPIYAPSLEVDSNDREIIRETIIDKVNSILWLDSLVADEKLYQERLTKAKASTEKCMICTLPYGTCEHTREWISESYERRTRIPDDEDLDKTIDDMLSVIGDFKLETKPILEDIDLDGMQWKTLEQRPTDRIGSTNVCLFSPDERGWHSTVKLSANLVLVFGGLKYRVNKAPPLFTAEPTQDEVEFLNDIRAYDTQNLAWYGVRARGKKNGERDLAAEAAAEEEEGSIGSTEQRYLQPEGRYGHIAAALDENRMLIFGGRGADGRNLRDTWIYHYDADCWEQVHVNEALQLPLPRARYFSACVSVPIPPLGQARTTSSIACQLKETDRDVYMFGGTSGTEYFGDLWVFRGSASMLRWEPLIAVGIPPSPRFGHQMVVLFDEKGVEANHYQNGGQQLMVLGGCTFRPVADMVGRNLVPAELSHQVHTIAGSMQATRKEKLTEAHLDVYILSITELIWRSTAYPGIKGTLPTARMHFSAACISHHVFVFGGLEASALRYNPAEHDGQTAVFVLDMSTMRWRIATATNSPDHLKEPLRIAQADVIRALRRCDEEKLRGLSLGALNGKTIELAEAQAVLEVCRWRQSVLQSEQLEHTSAPPARWGATLLAHGQRVLYIGGWEQYAAVPKGKSVVLNVEQEHERRRRLDDEYSAKLQRDRIRDQAEANMANVQSIYELRAIRQAELDSQTREAKAMTTEDLLSSLPPLFLPEPVKLVKANQHTIWIKWHRIMRNSKRQLLDPDTITYFVYMRVGFENFILGDRVFATVPPTQAARSPLKSSQHRRHNRPQASAYNVRTVFFDDDCKRYPAEITRASGCGKFDLLFDDGTVEKDVPRHRLKLAPPLDLSAVLPSLLSRPNTATTPRAGSANSVSGANSATGSRLGSPQRSTVSAADERRSLPSSPGRSRAHSPYTSRPDTAGNDPTRTDTSAASASTTKRASVGAALMAASTKASASMGALSVIPLEFAAAMRNRIQHRQRQRDRALHQIDKAFRGVRELTEEEIAEMNRQSKRSRRQQLRSGTASTLTSGTFDSMITPVGRRSPSGGLSATGRMSPNTTKREQTAVTFGDPTNLDDLFSFGEPVPPSQYENEPLTICVAEPQTTGPKLTVRVDPRWQLVYVGNDNDCSVTHLVPEGVLEREPDIRVPVSFCYQVHGADEPYYEHSRLSAPVVFFTQPSPSKTVTVSKATAKGVNTTKLLTFMSKDNLTDRREDADERANKAKKVDYSTKMKQLMDKLEQKKLRLFQLSEDVFDVNQEYMSMNDELRILKGKYSKNDKTFLDSMVEAALKEADLRYRKETLEETCEVVSDISHKHNSEVEMYRSELKHALQNYQEARRNAKKLQSEFSKLSDSSRVQSLNFLAFCKYSHSAQTNEINKLSVSEELPSKKELLVCKREFGKCAEKSRSDLSNFYKLKIQEFQREERLQLGKSRAAMERNKARIDGLLGRGGNEAVDTVAPTVNHHINVNSLENRIAQKLLLDSQIQVSDGNVGEHTGVRLRGMGRDAAQTWGPIPVQQGGGPERAGTAEGVSGKLTPSPKSWRSYGSTKRRTPVAPVPSYAQPVRKDASSTARTPRGPLSPTPPSSERKSSSLPPHYRAQLSELYQSKKKAASALNELQAVRTRSVFDPRPFRAVPGPDSPVLLDCLLDSDDLHPGTGPNMVQSESGEYVEQDRAIGDLMSQLCAAEGKFRQLNSIREGLDMQLVKQAHFLMLVARDLQADFESKTKLSGAHLCYPAPLPASAPRVREHELSQAFAPPQTPNAAGAAPVAAGGAIGNKYRYRFDPSATTAAPFVPLREIQENYEEYEQTIRTMLVQAAEVLKIRR